MPKYPASLPAATAAAGLVATYVVVSTVVDHGSAAPASMTVTRVSDQQHIDPAAGKNPDPFTIGLHPAKPTCPVYWNLDAAGYAVSGPPGWTEHAVVPTASGRGTVTASVGWRYNINARWALIASRHKATPYRDFIQRTCLVDPPHRVLSGHATRPDWHDVTFRPTPAPLPAPAPSNTQ